MDEQIDYQAMRARVMRRLEPQLRQRRHRALFFMNVALFFIVNFFVYSMSQNPLFQSMTEESYTYNGITSSYEIWQPYPLVIAATLLWFALLVIQFISVLLEGGRERLIQREMTREMELEKLRLELQIAQARGDEGQTATEKPKRSVRLSDDGELLPDDSLNGSSLRRSDAQAR